VNGTRTVTFVESLVEALKVELACREPKESEPDAEPSDELWRLREIAESVDAWQTQDGVWVHGLRSVYTPMAKEFAKDVLPDNRGEWYSTPELALSAVDNPR